MLKGKNLQNRINKTNLLYRRQKLALIQFKETPIRITTRGLVPTLSTVDYQGIISPTGRGVAFDAKECQSTTSFPLRNIESHQLEYLKFFEAMGGYSFFLINFYSLDKDFAYKTPVCFIEYKQNDISKGSRKSIPIKEFKSNWKVSIKDYLNLLS